MRIKKIGKVLLIIVCCVIIAALLLTGAMFLRQAMTSSRIMDDFTAVLEDPTYQTPVAVEDVHFITQEISCGYAIIEMLANWQGKEVNEHTLFEENNHTISTAMGTGFLGELGKQFPEWDVTRHVNLTNSEVLTTIHEALATGMPVPIEFAALMDTGEEKEWTLHFAVVTAMDLRNDSITVQNPYGYEEVYTAKDFLNATRYDSYENMAFHFKLGFAFGLFHKNTVYTLQVQ